MQYLNQRVRCTIPKSGGSSYETAYGDVTDYYGETVAGALYTVHLTDGRTLCLNHRYLTIIGPTVTWSSVRGDLTASDMRDIERLTSAGLSEISPAAAKRIRGFIDRLASADASDRIPAAS